MSANPQTCPLCERPMLGKGAILTVAVMTPEQRKLAFCEDADGCRRAAYDRIMRAKGGDGGS